MNVKNGYFVLKSTKGLDKGVFDVVSLQRITKNLCFNESGGCGTSRRCDKKKINFKNLYLKEL